jgi:hypothetical protein
MTYITSRNVMNDAGPAGAELDSSDLLYKGRNLRYSNENWTVFGLLASQTGVRRVSQRPMPRLVNHVLHAVTQIRITAGIVMTNTRNFYQRT